MRMSRRGALYVPSGFDPVFSNNTWEDIILACQENAVPDAWAVGDQKSMTIDGADYAIDIIGRNHDTYTAGGTAPLTLQLHDCYGSTFEMNSGNSNSGGWENCRMRTAMLPSVFNKMPVKVQGGIKEVNKLASAGSKLSTIVTSVDKLFLLSEIEIFGSTANSKSGEGSQYAYYSAGNSKVKNYSGSAAAWWERSPYGAMTSMFCIVLNNGASNASGAVSYHSFSFAFCF